jgi:hypothetical protein
LNVAPESLHLVEEALAEYLRTADGDAFAARYRALPLYAEWYGTTYLTASGKFLYLNEETAPPRLENDLNDASRLVALVLAAERYPQLRALLPQRPAGTPDCEDCGGGGHVIIMGNASNIICGPCNGLGWRGATAAEDDHEHPYPSFDEALDAFRAFAQRLSLSTELVFLSGEHALLIGDRLYVTEDAFLTKVAARQAYERAVAARLGVMIAGVGELSDNRVGIAIAAPMTEADAVQRMYPNGLKMTIPEKLVDIRPIGRLRMKWLRLTSGRRAREATRFWFQ